MKMSNPFKAIGGLPEYALAFLMLFQGVCAAFFVSDVARDIVEADELGQAISAHISLELFANVALVLGIVVEAMALRWLLRQKLRHERALSAASGALDELMQDYFRTWALTPAEIDVATFTIKGFSIAEIAEFRQSAEGTVKSQLNAIYRKSGLAGRGQLVSVLIEDLLNGSINAGGAELKRA